VGRDAGARPLCSLLHASTPVGACHTPLPCLPPTQVLKQLYALKQAGVDEEMDRLRPNSNYNPVTDCGCSIM
jgi:hypothetical protein